MRQSPSFPRAKGRYPAQRRPTTRLSCVLLALACLAAATRGGLGLETARAIPQGAEGHYAGTYSGDDQGIFDMRLTPDGQLRGFAFSRFGGTITTASGTVQVDGGITFAGGSDTIAFSGTVDGTGKLDGTWTDTAFGASGTFAGKKTFYSPADFAGDYEGSFRGTGESGTFTVTVDAQGALSGSASDSRSSYSLTGLLAGNGEFYGASSDGEVFSGKLQAGGTFSGASSDPVSGESTASFQGKRTSPASATPIAKLSASPQEGLPPLPVDLDGASSSDPNGGTISAYYWSFGDGLISTTTSPAVSHTYADAGSYVATLIVESSGGLLSAPAQIPIYVGAATATDQDFFASKAQLAINFAKHAQGLPSDTLKLSGFINPAGLPDDLSAARIVLRVNDLDVAPAAASRGRSAQPRAATGVSFVPLLSSNGALSISLGGSDLRNLLNIKNESGSQAVRAEVEVEISGVPIDTPKVRGVIRTPFQVKQNAAGRGSYSFLALGSQSGVFKSTRTLVTEGAGGGHACSAQGPIVAEFATALVPNGDLTVTVGGDGSGSTGAPLTIPLAALQASGSGDSSVFTYSKTLQEVPGLLKFQLSNAKRKFTLLTSELADTLVPPAGSPETAFDLHLVLSVPTASGVQTLQTVIEIKRTSNGSKSWSR